MNAPLMLPWRRGRLPGMQETEISSPGVAWTRAGAATAARLQAALKNLGHLLERRGDTASAQAVVDSATPVEAEHRLHALNNSARLLEQLRRYPEAEALMRPSLELKAAQPDVIQRSKRPASSMVRKTGLAGAQRRAGRCRLLLLPASSVTPRSAALWWPLVCEAGYSAVGTSKRLSAPAHALEDRPALLARPSKPMDRDGCKPGKACTRGLAATRLANLQAAFKACRTAAASGSCFSCKPA